MKQCEYESTTNLKHAFLRALLQYELTADKMTKLTKLIMNTILKEDKIK